MHVVRIPVGTVCVAEHGYLRMIVQSISSPELVSFEGSEKQKHLFRSFAIDPSTEGLIGIESFLEACCH